MSAFEWDEAKNAINLRKHGIDFDEARLIFDGPILTTFGGTVDGELRELSFGLLGHIIVLAVVHTDRHGITRIISARKATKQERTLFNAYLKRTLGTD